MTICKDIHYVGVNDRQKYLFEGLWPLPYGVSYNAYLIDDEKTCLVDTVDVAFFSQFIENIRHAIGNKPVDYLVVNHMEPDHSGSIVLLKKFYPDVKIIGNKKTFAMMQGFYGVADDLVEVKNGDFIDLGSHQLAFVLTPMVHWPETMMTLCTDTTAEGEGKVLFAGDAFGCFGALNGGVVDDNINCDEVWPEMQRYYSNIVGKYGTPVQAALKKLAGTDLSYICPTHGPVWHKHLQRVVAMYNRMSLYDTDPGLVVCYGTMYGNTERMAEVIARAANEEGVRDIVLYNVSKTHHSYILRDIFRYKGLIVGAPTYNTGLYHEMEVLLSEIAGRDIKNHLIGWFGSHGWASKAVGRIAEWNENHLHFEPVGVPVDMRLGMNDDIHAQCVALGKAMAARLLATEE